jgi:molybdate transport system substrate-binding protein
VALGVLGFVQTSFAQGEVRVLCSNSIRAAVVELTPQIEKALGRKISIEFSASTALKREIDGGAAFDLAILTPGIAAELVKSGKLAAGSAMNLASSDLGVGIKEGSVKADVSTDAGMKARLLAAKSLTWTDGGASAGATVEMIKALGLKTR